MIFLRRLSFIALLFAVVTASGETVKVTSDHATGLYRVGETVHWTIEWTGTSAAPAAHYVAKRGGATEIARGDVLFTNKVAHFDTTFDRPDTVLLQIDWDPASTTNRVYAGAVASPESIVAAADEPPDFDAFWQAKLAELAAVPTNPQLEVGTSGKAGVDYWKITMDNIRGTHIRGQIARPSSGQTFPALLIVQYAGVYGLQKSWVTDRAAEGWLTLNINAHDLPIDESVAYYQQQEAGPLRNYWNIGNDDRDTSYYLRMYLSCYRAVEYLRSRSDWDGSTIVVMGTSQGGQQTLVTAGIHPAITAALALVPAACDMLAPDAGRAPGFPSWYFNTAGKDAAKVRAAGRYYDPVNFARRIQCPVLVGAGLHDETLAPPSSILAAVNAIPSPKEIHFLQAGHNNDAGSQDPYNTRCYGDWLPALRTGHAPPVIPFPARPAQVAVPTGSALAQITNLSTRGIVADGDNALIAGFVISGPASKTLLILGAGLNLSSFGVQGAVARPHLTLYHNVNGANVSVAQNSDWQTDAANVSALISQVGAEPFSPSTNVTRGDAGFSITLAPGVYSVVVTPDVQSANRDGVGLVEIYDVTPADGSRLANISSRGLLETGARQMIVGVVVSGSGHTRLLFRGIGPTLGSFGVGHPLANPAQSLHQFVGGTQPVIAENDDSWNSSSADQSRDLARSIGAFATAKYSIDSALLQRLAPGVYSSVIAPGEGNTGVALAEIYEINDP